MTNPSEEQLTALREAAEKATLGSWRREALGGCSTVLTKEAPRRADNGIPTYGYRQDGEHCLAYVFRDGQEVTRQDFVCLSHEDADYIVKAQPAVILSLIHALTTLTAERDRLREALIEIERVGTTITTTRVGDMWDPNGYDDDTKVSEEAEIARSALQPNTGEAK